MFPIILKHPQGCMEFGLAIHTKWSSASEVAAG